jgi:hypothetical protein
VQPSGLAAAAVAAALVLNRAVESCNCSSPAGIAAALQAVSVASSFFGPLSFDEQGRLRSASWLALQVLPASPSSSSADADADAAAADDVATVVAPLEKAAARAVFPMPSWSDRVARSRLYTRGSEWAVLAGVLVALCYFASLLWLVASHRDAVVIRSSSPAFLYATLAGAALFVCAPAVWVLDETRATCAARVWLLSIGFTMVFAALLTKSYRVHRIFEPARLKDKVVSTRTLLAAYFGALACEVAFLAVWTAVAMPEPALRMPAAQDQQDFNGGTGSDGDFTFGSLRPAQAHRVCSISPGFLGTSLALKLALLVVLLVQSWRARGLPEVFNEGAAVASAVFKFVFALVVLGPLIAATADDADPVQVLFGADSGSVWLVSLQRREQIFLIRSFGYAVAASVSGLCVVCCLRE